MIQVFVNISVTTHYIFLFSIDQSSFLFQDKQYTKLLVSAPYFSLHITIDQHIYLAVSLFTAEVWRVL